ncbi:CheR family methyltransferase [Bacillus tuaregi]|uniref:CheR family methyltransferase n=1 Tax=Bacillus tuaregi TaxID=1816695 RepID=UPI0008F832F2|nr:protein-glutamate O-methyltransferase CheR [Bacillus tuaregi]
MIKITEKEFNQLSAYIRDHYGIFLKKEKKLLVTGRLQNVLMQEGFTNFTDYYQYVVTDKTGHAVDMLLDKITTNHTFFMRESNHFFFFRDTVLPQLKQQIKDHDLRVWCAGCSTGEEAYTIAMVMDEFLGEDKKYWDAVILATDISDKVLRMANRGIYQEEDVRNLPVSWILKHFLKQGHHQYAVQDSLKKEVIFRRFNLMEARFPFKKKFHTIFCRNVMIYFDQQTKLELVKKFYDSLEPGGYLFIGHSESLFGLQTGFKYVMPAIYQKQ